MLELEISGAAVYLSKQKEMVAFVRSYFLKKTLRLFQYIFFMAMVRKTTTDQKENHKCFLWVMVLLNKQNISINNIEKRVAARIPPT